MVHYITIFASQTKHEGHKLSPMIHNIIINEASRLLRLLTMIMSTLEEMLTENGCFSPRVSNAVHWNRVGVGKTGTGAGAAMAIVGVACWGLWTHPHIIQGEGEREREHIIHTIILTINFCDYSHESKRGGSSLSLLNQHCSCRSSCTGSTDILYLLCDGH